MRLIMELKSQGLARGKGFWTTPWELNAESEIGFQYFPIQKWVEWNCCSQNAYSLYQ